MTATMSRNAPCACGSGQRFKQCCGRIAPPPAPAAPVQQGLETWRQAVHQRPDDAASWNNLANACARNGLMDDAIQAWRRAITIKPDIVEVHLNLATALQDLERADEALSAYRRALTIDPRRLQALQGAGAICLAEGRLEEAAAAYEAALAVAPGDADTLVNFGSALRGLGRVDAAIDLFRKALSIAPDLAEAHLALGTALRLQGRWQPAWDSLMEAVRIRPDLASAMSALAESCADQGDFEGAEAWLRRAMAAAPDEPEAWAALPRMRRMTEQDGDWREGVRRLLSGSPRQRRAATLHYALGKYHDDIGQYAAAFENFDRANDLVRRRRPPHDREAVRRQMEAARRAHGADWFAEARGRGHASTLPVFIVGMLRSGTTLLEQMLASHPEASGAGELSYWGEAAARIAATQAAPGADLEGLARDYLSVLGEAGGDSIRIVDKMPGNFMHLGLIHAALPNARILHIRRNPIDTCLSIYFQHFEPTLTYANDLDDLADYFRRYEEMMGHWRQTLPEGAMLEIDYEALVKDPAATLQAVLDHLGLGWSDRCLDFHLTPRTIITASKWQARQKISTESLGRWRRYETFIGPLRGLASAQAQDARQALQPPR